MLKSGCCCFCVVVAFSRIFLLILEQHHDWAKKLANKFGNAAVMGAGATFGADLVNDAMRKF